jgi:phosphonate transport system permease protein
LPQVFPQLVAYTLYRWEVNIRASAVLGVVGAGGLGRELYVSLGLFEGRRTAALVLAVFALVTAVDLFSGWLRGRILAGPALAPRLEARPAAGDALEGVAG